MNLFALKRLIYINSKNLKSLTIKNSLFYENDRSVLKESTLMSAKDVNVNLKEIDIEVEEKRINDENEIIDNNNNKMLREINFTYQVKSIHFP